jgi:PTH1 family peptidyl-tRNA hydrolase
LDALARSSNLVFTDRRHGAVAEYRYKGKTFVLVKPTTYMNLSGKAVNYWLQHESVPVNHLIVLVDDLALPFGTVRVRAHGSDGGHNGLSHIIQTLGTQEFARLRFGIGGDFPYGTQIDYVLSPWSDEEKQKLPDRLLVCQDIIRSFGTQGIERTMNTFNNR